MLISKGNTVKKHSLCIWIDHFLRIPKHFLLLFLRRDVTHVAIGRLACSFLLSKGINLIWLIIVATILLKYVLVHKTHLTFEALTRCSRPLYFNVLLFVLVSTLFQSRIWVYIQIKRKEKTTNKRTNEQQNIHRL